MVKNLLVVVYCIILAFPAMASELVIKITEGVDNPVPVAIVPFSWNGNKGLPEDVAQVIQSDLENSGQFKALKRSSMLSFPHTEADVYYRDWRYLNTEYLIVGVVNQVPNGYQVQYELFDIYREQRLASGQVTGTRRNLRRLAHEVSDIVFEQLTGLRGAFSTRIAYVSSDHKTRPSFYRLNIADADGHNRQVVLESRYPIMSPAWSRDASKLAYVSFETGRPAIYIQNLKTGKRERIKSYKGLNGSPSWSPDGKRLALVLSKDGNPEIYILNLETNHLTRVTKHYGIDTEPTWSVDGKSIIFTSDRGGKPQIYQVSLNDGWVERLTFEGDYNARGRLTHDGRHLVLVNRTDGMFHIGVQDLHRSTMEILTQSLLDESPSIAPNGIMIIYATQEGGKDVLRMVSIDGRVRIKQPSVDAVVREPAWSPYLR
jgi:TolB protein